MPITAKDIAEKLGLSRGAVSMALNGRSGVSEQTRALVWKTAQELGFDFSRLNARKQNRPEQPGTVYLIIYKRHGTVVTDTPFFSELTEGIDSCCKQMGLFLRMTYLYGTADIRRELEQICASGCIGIILLGTEMQWEDFSVFQSLGIPMVLLDTYFERANVDCVLINNIQGAYLATSFLISRFQCQPGYLRSSYPINNFSERADGFYKAIRESGMSTSRSVIHRLTPSVEGAYADMSALLAQGEKPARCYFADNDLIAVGAMRALTERGYRIPEDVAVVGFDDMPLAGYADPPLATIHVAKRTMGELAVRQLSFRMGDPNGVPVKVELSTKFIKRRSV